jgi:hydroxypyruvate isomerase
MMKSMVAGAALAAGTPVAPAQASAEAGMALPRKARIRQSVSRWCYPKSSVDQLSAFGASIGLKGVDLLQPDEFQIPARYGLVCTMGYADAGTIEQGLNRTANHAAIEAGLRKNVPLAAKAHVPNVITFSGVRAGMSDDEGLKNSIAGLNRVKKIVEDHGVVLCVELLNSKIDHPGYMADHTAWGVRLMEAVNSPNVRLLYDIYHMQIQEGDLIRTLQQHIEWIAHFHTGGVPGRHELNDHQEVNWVGVMRAIAETPFRGYVAHEFVPAAPDPLLSLRQAVDLCDV